MGNPSNPFGQARQFMQLSEDQDLTVGDLQALFNSGLQSALFRAAKEVDLSRVDRSEFERVLGINPSVFRVKLGGPGTTDEIVSNLGFPAHRSITQKNFPLRPHAVEDVEIEIIDPGCSFSEEEGLKFLANANLGRPAHEHALRFAEQCGKTTTSERKPFVVFLHEASRGPVRIRRVLYLYRHAWYRKLFLHYPGRRFSGRCVLAGVRPRKQPSAA